MSFLCWAASGKFIPFTGLLQGGLLLSIPLILEQWPALLRTLWCYQYCYRRTVASGRIASGVLASLTHRNWLGLIIAPLAGVLVSLLLATFAIRFAVDQVILGFVLNVLVIGITGFLYQRLLIPYKAPGTPDQR